MFSIVFGFTFALFIVAFDDAVGELSLVSDCVDFVWSPAAGIVLFVSVMARDVTNG